MASLKKSNATNSSTSLEDKIRKQAKRLCDQQEYINILETRVLQYNPEEILPITSLNLKKKLSRNSNSIPLKDAKELPKKYNSLSETSGVSKVNNTKSAVKPRSTINSNSINSSNLNPEEYIKIINTITEEKENLLSQLRNEIITNDEQRNYIEILKQALESSWVKTGLIGLLDTLKQQYYPSSPKEEYARIILVISNIKQANDTLSEETKKQSEQIKIQSISIEKYKTENTKLQTDLKSMESDFNSISKAHSELVSKNKANEDELKTVSKYNNELSALNEELSGSNNYLTDQNKKLINDNIHLADNFAALKHKNDTDCNELNKLIVVKSQFDALSKESWDIKQINKKLLSENNYYAEQNYHLQRNVSNLTNVNNENAEWTKELNKLKSDFEKLFSEKNRNEVFFLAKLEAVTKEKNILETIVYKADAKKYLCDTAKQEVNTYIWDNKKWYDKNKELNHENIKWVNESKFFSQWLFRILKSHIRNINVRNILYEWLNLNEKNILLAIEVNKQENKLNKYEKECRLKGKLEESELKVWKTELMYTETQLNENKKKIWWLENELKGYEGGNYEEGKM